MKLIIVCLLLFIDLSRAQCEDVDEPECKVMCTRELAPVTGTDHNLGKTQEFSNLCELEAQNTCYGTNYVVEVPSTTPHVPAEACNILCPAVFQPVVGVDPNGVLRDFSNPCEMDAHNACYGTEYSPPVYFNQADEEPSKIQVVEEGSSFVDNTII